MHAAPSIIAQPTSSLVSLIPTLTRADLAAPSPMYKPLNAHDGSIRLLAIQPASTLSAPIVCQLEYIKLSQNSVFEALSYTWGTPEPKKSIRLEDYDFDILENLEAALRRLRKPGEKRLMWIDAICINQENLQERGEQVIQMRSIYERAEKIIIWLGEPDHPGQDEWSVLKSLANANGWATNQIHMWRQKKNFDLSRGFFGRYAAMAAGEYNGDQFEHGELGQLLDRPWWKRVWIVQELVLAKKATLMCGPDEVNWDAIKARMEPGGWLGGKGLKSNLDIRPLRNFEGSAVLTPYVFPDTEYLLLNELREKHLCNNLNESIYYFLYQCRVFQTTNPRDRIYAFLGLAEDINGAGLVPDYVATTAEVYLDVGRRLIASHKHLLLLNLRREKHSKSSMQRDTTLFSLVDQCRFLDTNATVVDAPGQKPRKGWVRLPAGWERRVDHDGVTFYDHSTGTLHQKSPLLGSRPVMSQTPQDFERLPENWEKRWDNLGRVNFVYLPAEISKTDPRQEEELDLPSWVPDWSYWSMKDPKPLISLTDFSSFKQRYWASQLSSKLRIPPNPIADPRILCSMGMQFNTIVELAPAWCPEPHNLPVSRKGVTILKEWERMALQKVENCPYEKKDGRYDAFWRTHIADYPGDNAASIADKEYFESWCDRTGWTPIIPEIKGKGIWTGVTEVVHEYDATDDMAIRHWDASTCIDPIMDPKVGLLKNVGNAVLTRPARLQKIQEDYTKFRDRIYKAVVNRAMFVTKNGYLGLAPWNARVKDVVCVLLGGCTPYLLRRAENSERYRFVGECYVYGIMAGELFDSEKGEVNLRTFEIV